MKVLMAPVNFGGQPYLLARHLRDRGVDARLMLYTPSRADQYAFGFDENFGKRVSLQGVNRIEAQLATLKECLEYDYDIYHFWFRTLVYGGLYAPHIGLDLPLIKARGKKIIFRFTGSDLRDEATDRAANPYSAFHYGFESNIDERQRSDYIDYLRAYVDLFIVQDPEMRQFLPEAEVVPRAIGLDQWTYVGPCSTDEPLVVHAPTNKVIKGTDFVLKAVEELRAEGLRFRFQLVEGMAQPEAQRCYAESDIVIDQLHVGAYGLLALETMALGKAVMVYIRDDLFRPVYGELPVMNANPDTVKDRLRQLILDAGLRQRLGDAARAFVEREHDPKAVAEQLHGVYQRVLAAPTTAPMRTTFDVDYLARQLVENDKLVRQRQRRAMRKRGEIA